MRVLVADDDIEIVNLISIYLKNEQYEIVKVHDGEAALKALEEDPEINMVLLDIMMPKMDGMEVLEKMRARGDHRPVIILSAKADRLDKVTGLISGADDYVTKPFDELEVIARIKSLIRRQNLTPTSEQPVNQDVIEVGPLIINKKEHDVKTQDGVPIQLTSSEFNILHLLASNPGEVYSSDQILAEVWGEDATISSKTVMVHVSHLRDKIDVATQGEKVVQTVWGVGYKIEA